MKSLKIFLLIILGIVFICATPPVTNRYLLSKDYAVTILGTSNLHAWNETVGIVMGDCSVSWNDDGSFNLDAINLKMEVHSIKSDMGSVMNNNTYKALKADNNPEIAFTLNTPVKLIKTGSTATSISAKGTLTIAGTTRSVDMQVKISIQDHKILSFDGSQTIEMTDYNVTPPTALLGMLKTGDEITLNFKTNFVLTAN
jgi:polyisoprenoid-binding protein YceI